MKTLVEKEFGGDGQKLVLLVDDDKNLVVAVKYPIAKLLAPVTNEVDVLAKKLEDLIPGDWDKAVIDPLVAGAKAELLALLGG